MAHYFSGYAIIQLPDFLSFIHEYLSEIFRTKNLTNINKNRSVGKISTVEGIMDDKCKVRQQSITITDEVCKLREQMDDVLSKLDQIVATSNNNNRCNII